MDNLIAQIAQLRASAENTLTIANGVLAAAQSVAGGGAGLPPTAGGGGAAVLEWPEIPTHLPGTAATAAAVAAVEALLAPPAPITAQLTLGVATPATFGNAETNAQHYLMGKGLYEPTVAQKRDAEMKLFLENAARDAYTTACGTAEQIEEARQHFFAARMARAKAEWAVRLAEEQVMRYQAYHDGTWASIPGGKAYFVYRFFVFEEVVTGPFTGTQAADWKSIGLLNPHAYIGSKLMSKRVCFLDFVDATQPAPDATAYWRAKMVSEEDEDEGYLDEDEEEDEVDEEEEAAFWAAREAANAARYATPIKAAAHAASWSDGGCSTTPAAEWAHAAAKAGGSLSDRLAALDAADAVPAGFSPVIEGAELLLDRLDPRAESNKELREDLWEGRWTTLPDGRRVLIYRHHAFAPPADGSYRTAQPLQHLGFYHFHDRTIDATTSLPALPTQAAWPF